MSAETRRAEEHPAPAPQLERMAFLVGRLRGEGWLGDRGYRYRKEVTGRRVAGGHHLILDMTAEYPLRNGSTDRHSTLLVVSAGSAAGSLVCHAFTDGGTVVHYRLDHTEQGIVFDDFVPHGCKGERARKWLRPFAGGYEETLEIDRGDGAFAAWSQIRLERQVR